MQNEFAFTNVTSDGTSHSRIAMFELEGSVGVALCELRRGNGGVNYVPISQGDFPHSRGHRAASCLEFLQRSIL